MAILLPEGRQSFRTTAGLPLVGGKVFTYSAGTSTPKATYSNAAGTTANTNPVVLDARGEATIFWDGSYKVILKDASDNVIWTVDGVAGADVDSAALVADLANTSSATKGPALVGYSVSQSYAIGTVGGKLREIMSVLDFPTSGADDTSRFQTAVSAARAAGAALVIPQSCPTLTVSSSTDISGIHLIAYGRNKIHIQASSAQFDVLTTTGNTTIEGLYVHGGWDGSTAGLLGDVLVIKATSPSYPYGIALRNVTIRYAKKRGIYWERGGYSSAYNVDVRACGLHALECYAPSGVDSMTTVSFGGFSVFSDCPNGYGIKITNCICCSWENVIVENSSGIQFNGSDNRSLSFGTVYQENTNSGKFFVDNSSAGIGLLIGNVFGGSVSMDPMTNWFNVVYLGTSSSITVPALSTQGRRVSADSLQQTTSTTGGLNTTVTSISVPPGNWRIDASFQTQDSAASAFVGAGIRITTDNTATGYANDTSSNFVPGAAEYRNTPAGAQSDVRLNCSWYYDNATSGNVTVYLRAFINISSGTIAYRGILNAARVM